jgi:hypothetical protein
MDGLLHKARRYLFGYDPVESKNRRQAPTGRLRSEDKELLPHQRRRLTSASRDIHRNFTIAAWAIRKHLDYVSTFSFQSRTGSADLDGRIGRIVRSQFLAPGAEALGQALDELGIRSWKTRTGSSCGSMFSGSVSTWIG